MDILKITRTPLIVRVLFAAFLSSIAPHVSAKGAEKTVTFYNSYGYLDDDIWRIPLKARVVEKPNILAKVTEKGARKILASKAELKDLSDTQKTIYASRAYGFLADNESDEIVSIVFDKDPLKKSYVLELNRLPIESDRNGNIEAVLVLAKNRAHQLLQAQKSSNGWLSFKVNSEDHQGEGQVQLIPKEGISIISDIDDTVKVTEIPLGEVAVLRNTFFKEFRASPGMVELYNEYPDNVTFHYISGGPWQLYVPLTQFLFSEEVGFPIGSMHMKNVRTNPFESESYSDISKLVAGGSKQATFEQKVTQISQLLEDFPKRKFILIGDSGEKDPEIYRKISRLFKPRILEIKIRDLTNDRDCNALRLKGMTIINAQLKRFGNCENRLLK